MGFGFDPQLFGGPWIDSHRHHHQQQQQQHQSYSMDEEEARHSANGHQFSGPVVHKGKPGASNSFDYDHFSRHQDNFGGQYRLHGGGVGHQGGWSGHDKLQKGNWLGSNSHGYGYGVGKYPHGGGGNVHHMSNNFPNSYGYYKEYSSEEEGEYEEHHYGPSRVDQMTYEQGLNHSSYGYHSSNPNYRKPNNVEWTAKGVN